MEPTEAIVPPLNLPWSIEHEGGWYGTDIYRIVDDTGDEVFGTARFTDDERATAERAVAWINAYPQLHEVLRDWYHMFRPVMQRGTEGEALLERTAAALGIEL